MSVGVYLDHHVHGDIVRGLRARHVDCLTAAEDGTRQVDDEDLLARATLQGRILVSMDEDLLSITTRWLRTGRSFAGLIYAEQLGISVGKAVMEIELIVGVCNEEDLRDTVIRIPI